MNRENIVKASGARTLPQTNQTRLKVKHRVKAGGLPCLSSSLTANHNQSRR